MPLYLMRHGRAYEETSDPARSLTPEGKKEVDRIAELAAAFNISVLQIFHSGKAGQKRRRKSWPTT